MGEGNSEARDARRGLCQANAVLGRLRDESGVHGIGRRTHKGVAGAVSIEIADSRGRVITTRSNTSANAGLNRFTWDMRSPDAHGIQGGTFLAGGNLRGPVAVPGSYRVTLRVGNQSFTESAEIRKNPRSSAAQEDLESQFDFLIGVRDRLSQIHDTINTIRSLQKDVGDTVTRAKAMPDGTPVVTAGEKLSSGLQSVLLELYEPRYTGQDDQMLIFPLKLNNRYAGLQGYISGADAAPTAQEFAVYEDLSEELEGHLSRLKAILDTDAASFNRLLQSRGLPALRW